VPDAATLLALAAARLAGPGPGERWSPPTDELLDRVRSARRPLVLAGPGVVRDGVIAGLHGLAVGASVGVLNTWGAKGIFDWRSRHHLATVGLQEGDAALGGVGDCDLLVRIGVDELGLDLRDPDLRVRIGDARLTIGDEDDDAYDLVVGDAFGGLSVPWHLTTIEMVTEVDRVLRNDGIYVLNVIDAGPRGLVRAELATLARRFEHLAVIAPPDGPAGNHVLVASDRPMDIAEPQPDEGRLVVGAALDRFIGGAEPLRDDFAPADQLLSRG